MQPFFKILLSGLLGLLGTIALAAVDINTANQAELEAIAGIGPAMSTKMLDARKQAVFQGWADLIARVKGMGVGNAARFSKAGLTVNGTGFEPTPAAAARKLELAPAPGNATR